VKIIIEAQLPPMMARWLKTAGHEAEHVLEVGLLGASDTAIWTHAERVGAASITKDEDFAERAKTAGAPPVIVWLRIGNASNPELRTWFEPRLAGIVQMATEGSRIIEVI
jgi:predicted nuclease of predicted toxin-antitoxin system